MSIPPTPPPSSSSGASGLLWWFTPVAVGLLAGSGALVWVALDRDPAVLPPSPAPPGGPQHAVVRRPLPMPPAVAEPGRVHWVGHGVENGVKVVYVQAVPGGDILVVDAATGRLIESRPDVKSK
jgi:hypothetical protein